MVPRFARTANGNQKNHNANRVYPCQSHGPCFHPLPNNPVRVRTAGADPQRAMARLDNLKPASNCLLPVPADPSEVNQPDPGEPTISSATKFFAGGPTHRAQAQHRARTLEYPIQVAESTKSRCRGAAFLRLLPRSRSKFRWGRRSSYGDCRPTLRFIGCASVLNTIESKSNVDSGAYRR
jgi:hypothetical protein